MGVFFLQTLQCLLFPCGRGVACDFCRVLLVTSVPVSLVTSQSLPLQIAAVSLLADLWLPWRPFLALLSLLLPLPPPLHPLSWCTRCSRGSAHDAHEVDRFGAKHVVALVATYYIPFPPPFEAEHEGRRLKPLVRIFAFLTISLCLCICMCLNASMPICPDLRAGGKNPPSCPKQEHKENRSNSKDQSTPSLRRSNSNPAANPEPRANP